MIGAGKLLIIVFVVIQSSFAFCQWETDSIKVPIVECVNKDFYLVIDSIIDLEKKQGNYSESLNFIIKLKELPKDTNRLLIYITLSDCETIIFESNPNGFFEYLNHSCFLYNSTPNILFNRLGIHKKFYYKKLKPIRNEKNRQNKTPNIDCGEGEVDNPFWKYFFYNNENKFELFEHIRY